MTSSMIRSDQYNRVCVLSVDGDLAGEAAGALRRAVDEAMAEGRVADVVVDFAEAEFIDSAGLESLLWARRRCETAEGRLKLAALDDGCRKILEITQLTHHFECHPDVSAAMKS